MKTIYLRSLLITSLLIFNLVDAIAYAQACRIASNALFREILVSSSDANGGTIFLPSIPSGAPLFGTNQWVPEPVVCSLFPEIPRQGDVCQGVEGDGSTSLDPSIFDFKFFKTVDGTDVYLGLGEVYDSLVSENPAAESCAFLNILNPYDPTARIPEPPLPDPPESEPIVISSVIDLLLD